jgi:hypothetical protein
LVKDEPESTVHNEQFGDMEEDTENNNDEILLNPVI